MNAILFLAALKVLAVGNGVALEDLSIRGFVADRLDVCCRNHIAKTDPMYYAREFRSRAETTGQWQTEFWGKYMLSAVPLAFARNDAALKARIAESVKEVIANQEPDGYIGNYPPEKRAQSGGWDLWGAKYTMRGLLVWYEYAKDPAALAAAEKLAGHVMALFGPGRRNLNETGCFRGLPSCSMLGAIVRLYRFTGKEPYRDFATYIVGQLDLDGRAPRLLADADVAPWERVTGPKVWLDSSRKSYEQMSCYQGLVEYSIATGDRRGLEAAAKTAEAIRTGEINIVGGASCSENWYGGATNQVTTHVFENETCVLTTWMRLCELLLGATGEAKWADELEKTFYNAYLGAMRPDGSAFEVYAALSGRRHAGSNHCRLYTNCCTANGPRGFLAFLRSVMTAEKGTVKLNQYVSGDASVVLPDSGGKVTLETYALYPKMNTASIRYREREPKAFVLKLRIPSWGRKTEVRLNGKALEGPVAGEYFAIDREWRSGDQVDVAFDYTPQKFELRGHMAFKIGPLVLARDRRFADGDLGETIARHRWIADPMETVRVFPTRTARADMYFTAIGLVATGQHTKDPAETYPTAMSFCDYASAGNTWTDDSAYRVWLPIEAPLAEEDRKPEVAVAAGRPWRPAKAWHGFNLLGLFRAPWNTSDSRAPGFFKEEHFRWMKEWGFDFARLPMDYRNFVSTNNWLELREEGFRELDKAVRWGRQYGIHVQPSLHRAPGFTIFPNGDEEPCELRKDARAQKAFSNLWRVMARRYRGIPNEELSFNPMNEPCEFTDEQFTQVFGDVIRAIRTEDPDRFVMLDGNDIASRPVAAFYSVPSTGQAFRGYTPHAISHYGSRFITEQPRSEPSWPIEPELIEEKWNFEMPEKTFAKYAEPRRLGYPVMVGEFGCYNKISHATCLKWMDHCLKLWTENGVGWALWNLNGAFGILDSGRTDVAYEDFHGHKLDRQMLDLLIRWKNRASQVEGAR